ncbi:MAG: tRNA glutamyl-Q(34) synthetase GluQRS [Gallionella sp.]|nr:tRNA glutamyl-Q(34) synthetase GluQRS [Gallionella sp.]
MSPPYRYRGRFAPSPTGPLHFGSLVAAVGSYLDAKHHQGKWLVRIEDLDTPRTVKGAADDILRTLETYGLYWDDDVGRVTPAATPNVAMAGVTRPTVLYQSQRTAAYEEAFQKLQAIGAVYPCCCTRKEIADSALHDIDGPVYPGTCRNGVRPLPNPPPEGEGTTATRTMAWRVRTDKLPTVRPEPVEGQGGFDKLSPNGLIEFDDALQGRITQHLESEIGDFIVKRADGLFAYQLAVVVDDAAQGITHVVRGADLLYSTTRQIYLQKLMGLKTPAYMHLPVVVNAQGEKLSKQTLAQPVGKNNAASTLFDALVFLRQQPPAELRHGTVEQILAWAVTNWQPNNLLNCHQLTIE